MTVPLMYCPLQEIIRRSGRLQQTADSSTGPCMGAWVLPTSGHQSSPAGDLV